MGGAMKSARRVLGLPQRMIYGVCRDTQCDTVIITSVLIYVIVFLLLPLSVLVVIWARVVRMKFLQNEIHSNLYEFKDTRDTGGGGGGRCI